MLLTACVLGVAPTTEPPPLPAPPEKPPEHEEEEEEEKNSEMHANEFTADPSAALPELPLNVKELKTG